MLRRTVLLFMTCRCAVRLVAQELENLQIHGFATQGFLFSSNNNCLTMKSSSGSLQWTEAAISVTDAVTDKLRIGIQLPTYQIAASARRPWSSTWMSGTTPTNSATQAQSRIHRTGIHAKGMQIRIDMLGVGCRNSWSDPVGESGNLGRFGESATGAKQFALRCRALGPAFVAAFTPVTT
jgi:hypothetical protein